MQPEITQVLPFASVEPIETAPFCGSKGSVDDDMSHRDWLEWAWIQA